MSPARAVFPVLFAAALAFGLTACGHGLGQHVSVAPPVPPPSANQPAAPAQEDDQPDLVPPFTSDPSADETPEEPEALEASGGAYKKAPSLETPNGTAPASRYAALGREACEAELDRRHIEYDRVAEARGVVAPLRLKGPLSGVTFRSNLSAAAAKKSPYDIYDCRLVLALDDFAKLLQKHDIVEVIHLSVWRPVGPKVPLKGPGRRHTGALAIDAGFFKTKNGKTLSVEHDFKGHIGGKPCSAASLKNATELHQIACEANEERFFNVLLTPDFNWAHRNHFHLEVTANVRWTLVR